MNKYSIENILFCDQRLVLRIISARNRFPQILISNIYILTCSIFRKGLISDELLWSYDIQVTHTKFIDKLWNILVLLNLPKTKSGIRSILKDASDIAKVLRIKGPGTLMELRIYQDYRKEICNILPSISLQLDNIQIVQSLLQRIFGIMNNGSHCDYTDLRYGRCQRHQYQYLLKKIIVQSLSLVTLLIMSGSEPNIDPTYKTT